jgi:hypothetical protein
VYVGIDFLLGPELKLYVIEVNVGLPGGAEEHDRAHRVCFGRPSGVFGRIEEISERVYGRPFADYLGSRPFLPALKAFKLWMDGQGPPPAEFHPALRLEDKWVQYQVLGGSVPMPETFVFAPADIGRAGALLASRGCIVLKRRLGRGGRGFRVIRRLDDLRAVAAAPPGPPLLVQEHIDSRVGGFAFSVRAVAFGGECVCAYANLARREHSNHGILALVLEGKRFGLSDSNFLTERFDERSWEAKLWFGESEPAYLRHNLYEDTAASAALLLPRPLLAELRDAAVKIERLYDALDFSALPAAGFEENARD